MNPAGILFVLQHWLLTARTIFKSQQISLSLIATTILWRISFESLIIQHWYWVGFSSSFINHVNIVVCNIWNLVDTKPCDWKPFYCENEEYPLSENLIQINQSDWLTKTDLRRKYVEQNVMVFVKKKDQHFFLSSQTWFLLLLLGPLVQLHALRLLLKLPRKLFDMNP